MTCTCEVCDGRDLNSLGIEIATKEVIPYVKQELLQLQFPTHPFPLKYKGLFESLLCYGQALAYNRAHSIDSGIYYTDNKWILQYSKELGDKFGMMTAHKSEVPEDHKLVCEFNTER